MRILVVDDDPLLLTSLREALAQEGHDVVTANGGKAGIDAFLDAQAEGKPFPVVFTDLGMPHVDGRAVTAAIKAAAPETVVLMLTGWGQRLVAEGETPEGVHAVLSKPPRLVDLRRCLAESVMSKTQAEPTEKVMS
jgi:CheY-like chemotaxis protein